MKKFSAFVNRNNSDRSARSDAPVLPSRDGRDLEIYMTETIAAFCESGNPKKSPDTPDETIFLTEIVQAAEASPSASRRAATEIKNVLSKKSKSKPYAKYNAIMLIEILGKNPGKSFIDGFDKDFTETIAYTLRNETDVSVQESLRASLTWMEREKENEPDVREQLKPLMAVWRQEKGRRSMFYRSQPPMGHPSNSGSGGRNLPPPEEVASRVYEANETARLLRESLSATPLDQIESPDSLVGEFAQRAKSAAHSMQAYLDSRNPYPDEQTFFTLMETHLTLTKEIHSHWRKVLDARRAMGRNAAAAAANQQPVNGQTNGQPPQVGGNSYAPPAGPPPSRKPAATVTTNAVEDPFADPASQAQAKTRRQDKYSLFGSSATNGQSARPQAAPGQDSTWQPTPSFINRQDSSTNNMTMSGASPPPPEPARTTREV